MAPVRIRPARPDEGERLRRIAIAAKRMGDRYVRDGEPTVFGRALRVMGVEL